MIALEQCGLRNREGFAEILELPNFQNIPLLVKLWTREGENEGKHEGKRSKENEGENERNSKRTRESEKERKRTRNWV